VAGILHIHIGYECVKKNMIKEEPLAANLRELLFAESRIFQRERPAKFDAADCCNWREDLNTKALRCLDDLSTEELALEFDARVQKRPKSSLVVSMKNCRHLFLSMVQTNLTNTRFCCLLATPIGFMMALARVGTGPSVAAASKPDKRQSQFFPKFGRALNWLTRLN
jgi:hypothetical protein